MPWFLDGILWAADARPETPTYVVLSFYLFVACGMAACFRFAKKVAPEALRRWAERQGFEILRQSEVGMIRKALSGGTTTQVDFELALMDRGGRKHEAVVRVGHPWLARQSADRCPVEIRLWDGAQPHPAKGFMDEGSLANDAQRE